MGKHCGFTQVSRLYSSEMVRINLKIPLTLKISAPLVHTGPELPQLNTILLLKGSYTKERSIFRVVLGLIWIMMQVSFGPLGLTCHILLKVYLSCSGQIGLAR